MALASEPLGFRPVRNPHGNTIPVEPFVAAAGAVYPGQIVYLTDAGTVAVYSGTTTGRTALIGAATNYVASGASDRELFVCTQPDQEYAVQMDDSTNLTALTDMLGANFAAVNLTTGNTTTLQSAAQLATDSGTTVNNGTTICPFRVLRVNRRMDNDILQTGTHVIVKINDTNLALRQNLGIL